MRYWLFDGRDAVGPFTEEQLRLQPGFSLDALIAPDGAGSADQWKPARQYLPAAPAPAPQPSPRPVPAPQAAPAPAASPRPVPAEPRPMMGRAADLKPEAAAAAPRPEPAGLSPEAIRRAKALELPARKTDPEPEPVLPPPAPPAPGLSNAAKAALAASVVLALGGGGWYASRRHKKPAPAAPAAVAAGTTTSGPPAAPMPAAGEGETLDFAKNFPLQSRPRKRPSDAMTLFTPKNWTAAQTLQELYAQAALEALGREAMATLERRGLTMADAEREVRKSPELWQRRADKFLAKNTVLWTVEAANGGLVVTATLPFSAPPRKFQVDAAAHTLQPLSLPAWFDVDPAQARKWAAKYRRLSEDEEDPSTPGPTAPVYRSNGAPPHPSLAKAPPSKPAVESVDPNDDEDADVEEPAPKPAPRVAKAARPKPAPAPKREEPEEEAKTVDTIFSDDDRPAPQPINPETRVSRAPSRPASPPAAEPKREPAPAPQASKEPDMPMKEPSAAPSAPPPSGAPSGGPKKSVADMSVEELQQYLNRK